MTKHFAIPAEITLEAADESEAHRRAEEIAEAAAETGPALKAAANVACADARPQLISG
jgi:hypothetical protein